MNHGSHQTRVYRVWLYFVVTAFTLVSATAYAHDPAPCPAPEQIVDREILYNQLVCQGSKLQSKGQLLAAIKVFEKALHEELFELPNVFLYARMAFIYAKLGQVDNARIYLARAKLSIELQYGLAKCQLTSTHSQELTPDVLYDQGKLGILKQGMRLDSPLAKMLFFKICQENSLDYYLLNQEVLDQLLADPMVHWYQKAKELLESQR